MINRFRDEWVDATKTEAKTENTTTIKGDMTITLNLTDEDKLQPPQADNLPEGNT